MAKTYEVQVDGRLTGEQIAKLKKGVHLDGRRLAPAAIKILRKAPERSLLEITLTEGRNREIRRILARLGHKVRRLKRTAIGPVRQRGLKPGSFRELTARELTQLRRSGTAPHTSEQQPRKGKGRKAGQ